MAYIKGAGRAASLLPCFLSGFVCFSVDDDDDDGALFYIRIHVRVRVRIRHCSFSAA